VAQRPTVVLGEFCAVLRLGLTVVLAEGGCRVIADGASAESLRSAVAAGADAVLLDLDAPTCADDALRLLAGSPGLRVVGCSAERPAMRVFQRSGALDERALEVPELLAAIARK
jgi:hypothetical protein